VYFFTHLFFSRMLYARFKNEAALDRWAFAFGNVKPDLPPDCFKERHTLENTLFTVYDRTGQLSGRPLSKKEFSIKSGEVCHFICDFFCRYHLNESMHKKIIPHLFYEIRLHLWIYFLSIFKRKELQLTIRQPAKSIVAIIFELRREYLEGRAEIKKDIRYALEASMCAFNFILQHAGCRQREEDSPFFATKGDNYEGSVIC